MAGHGEKYSRKKGEAILALLSCSTVVEAAKMAGIGEHTLWRWMQEDEFKQRYAAARRENFKFALTQIQKSTGRAVQVLDEIANDAENPASARVSAAKTILEMSVKMVEQAELEEKVSQLENTVTNLMEAKRYA